MSSRNRFEYFHPEDFTEEHSRRSAMSSTPAPPSCLRASSFIAPIREYPGKIVSTRTRSIPCRFKEETGIPPSYPFQRTMIWQCLCEIRNGVVGLSLITGKKRGWKATGGGKENAERSWGAVSGPLSITRGGWKLHGRFSVVPFDILAEIRARIVRNFKILAQHALGKLLCSMERLIFCAPWRRKVLFEWTIEWWFIQAKNMKFEMI